MFGSLLKAAVGVIRLPVDAALDVVTMPALAYDDKEFRVSRTIREIGENLDDATRPEGK